jgi:hypothetical protein
VEKGSRDSGVLRHVHGPSRSSFFIEIVVYFTFRCRTEEICLTDVLFVVPHMPFAAVGNGEQPGEADPRCASLHHTQHWQYLLFTVAASREFD